MGTLDVTTTPSTGIGFHDMNLAALKATLWWRADQPR